MLMSERSIIDFPKEYEASAIIANLAAHEILERLTLMTIKPKVILDLGCGTGLLTEKLREHYQDATVFGIDCDPRMIAFAKQNHGARAFCADVLSLPFPAHSIDMIIANFLLPWLPSLDAFFDECQRVMCPQALFMVTTLGEYSLQALPHDLKIVDMHDLGDAMLQKGLADPVLDVNQYTLSYRSASKMMHELKSSQLIPESFNGALQEECYDVNFEVIFAHAFASTTRANVTNEGISETRIPVSVLRNTFPR